MMAAQAVEAAALGVALHEVKALLRVEHNDEDALIAGFIRSAEAACEAFTGLALVAREVREIIPASHQWRRLELSPVRSITGVAAVTADGGTAALGADSFAVDVDGSGDGWVRLVQGISAGRVQVTYAAGLAGDWNGVNEPLRHGIVRLAAHHYGVRDGGAGAGTAPPALVAALWRPWRRLPFGLPRGRSVS
jgi:uncharacterized phiE125 gp8 family phage protein